jgi:hypothetical protein
MSVVEHWADSMDYCTCMVPFLEGVGSHSPSCGCLNKNMPAVDHKCGAVRGDGSYPGEECIRPFGHEGSHYG